MIYYNNPMSLAPAKLLQDGQLWVSGCTVDALCIGRHRDLELLEARNCFEVYESLVLGRKKMGTAFGYQTWLGNAWKYPMIYGGL